MDPTPRACTQATRAADVWRQLAGVNDPELDESLVDLGFVAGVDIDDAFRTKVSTEMDGLPVFVLSKELLIQNKRAVGRPQDIADLEGLEGT